MLPFRSIAALGILTVCPAFARTCKIDYNEWFIFKSEKGFGFYNDKGARIRTIKLTKKGLWEVILTDDAGKVAKLDGFEYSELLGACAGSHNIPDWLEGKFQDPGNKAAANFVGVIGAQGFDAADLNGDDNTDLVEVTLQGSIAVKLGKADGTFGSPIQYPTGQNPNTLLLADLNGDGVLDIVVANSGNLPDDTGSVSILLGTGGGAFQQAVQIAAGVAPASVAVADLNGDGKPDLAVASRGTQGFPGIPADTGSVSVLLGNGDGTFKPAARFATGELPTSLVALDFNGDSRRDLAVANETSGTVSLLLGDGKGGFQAALQTIVGDQPSYLGATDLNGDGKPDLVVAHSATDTISVWLAEGSSFRSGGRYLSGRQVSAFTFLQPTNDPRPTILVPDLGPRVLYLGVNLDGTLSSPPVYPVGASPSSVAAADFNGDQKIDLAVADQNGVSLLLGLGGNRFQDAHTITIPGGSSAVASLAAADFNGDGRADLVAVRGSGAADILIAQGDGTFQRAASLTGIARPIHVLATDLNGDGRPDVVVVGEGQSASDRGSVWVFLASGNAAFQGPVTYAVGSRPNRVAAGDVNGDGRPDLAVVNGGDLGQNHGGVSFLLANAGGGFQAAVNIEAGESPAGAAIADFDGDGKPDLVVSGQLTGAPSFLFGIAFLRGKGDGTFQPAVPIPTEFGPGPMLAGDFNQDGHMDLMASSCCGLTDMIQMLGNGDGTFRQSQFPGGADARALTAADFDGDGRLDLAIVDSAFQASHGSVAILLNSMEPMINVSAASNQPGTVAPDSIVSAYGTRLANQTAAAPTPNWPDSLGGATVTVLDAARVERTARIAYASPGQVNYLMPAGVAAGLARVTIKSGSGVVTSSLIGIENPSPGLFAVDAAGLAAAQVLRVRANGQRSVEPVVRFDSGKNAFVTVPIDLGPDSDKVYLLLYGTGIRGGSAQVSIGSVDAKVQYSGAQGEYPGLDQVNVLIPRSLSGRGLVTIVLTTGDSESNELKVQIK